MGYLGGDLLLATVNFETWLTSSKQFRPLSPADEVTRRSMALQINYTNTLFL